MKKYTSIYFIFFFFLLTCHAFAGTTSMSTYYPAPTGSYNQVQLNTKYQPPCVQNPPCPNGTVYADNTGTLHVVMNGQDTIFPQQCYNTFCTFDLSNRVNGRFGGSCSIFSQSSCAPGFYPVSSETQQPNVNDEFYISDNTKVISSPCCSYGSYAANACDPATWPAGSAVCFGTLTPLTNNAPFRLVLNCAGQQAPCTASCIPPYVQNVNSCICPLATPCGAPPGPCSALDRCGKCGDGSEC